MKRSNIGIKDIATFENAEDAYRKARKCKRYREEVLRFTDNLEEELYDLLAHWKPEHTDKGKPGAL